MPLNVQRLIVIASVTLLSACASTPRVPFQTEAKQKIKTIALVQLPDPEKYFLNPGQAPGGAVLYVFGALGGAILGGIEASRAENATNEFTASLLPQSPALGTYMTDELATAITGRGYTLTKLAQLPTQTDAKVVDCGDHKGKFDAVMITTLSAGYAVESQVEPRVGASVKLMSSDCSQTLFSDSFIYTNKEFPNSVLVLRGSEFSFASRELLIAGAPKAKDALRTGASELAKRIAQAL